MAKTTVYDLHNSFDSDTYLDKSERNIQRVSNKLDDYIKVPNEENIHDIRKAVRRLEASYRSLPSKKVRRKRVIREYAEYSKKLFSINSQIRDFDIINEKLQKYPSNPQRDNIIEAMKATRNERLERAKTIALAIKSTDIATILDEIGVTEKELQKRYNKILSRLISNIESNFPVVITNPLALEELHDLRIACKKLRYMLELLPDENKLATKTRESLQKVQDMLGSIHDCDFTIDYLRSLPQSSKEVQDIVNMENNERRLKFEQFMNYCNRRLRISPESFLIKIRSFKLPT